MRARARGAVLFLLSLLAVPAHAQLGALTGGGHGAPISRDQPVTFTADEVSYDRDNALVTATGHVEAWQNDHVIRADKITFDRNTNVAAASGNVVLLEPDGQVLFTDYAELSEGMRNGVLRGMRAILAENGRLAANGARRFEGKLNELSKVVYSTCNLCAKDPTRPPLWQIRALDAVQDLEHKRIEYQDATLQFDGVPVAYFPYFSHPDPSVKRQSGLLVPSLGTSSHIGQFFGQPYYIVLDDQSDATVTPLLTTQAGPQVELSYRRRFNDGRLDLDGSVGYLDDAVQGTILAHGQFNYDDTWRYGFDIEHASSSNYVRDFRLGSVVGDSNLLTSQVYLEGFGEGAYSRVDARFYQGLVDTIVDSKLPYVLPRYQYSYFGLPDDWGGRLRIDAGAFNVLRSVGTNTQRANLTAEYTRPFVGALGDLWKLTFHGDAAAYNATGLDQQPNFSSSLTNASTARGLPQAAVDVHWPFVRDGGDWGSQIIEPIAQVIVAPQVGDSQFYRLPNEDSLDLEFTDQNLFALNRFPGIDRLEGGARANVGLHGAWYLNGSSFDALLGQSYRATRDNNFPEASGLHDNISDVVGRATFAPTDWFDVTYRTRLDHKNGNTRMADALASIGDSRLRVTGGYLYTTFDPYSFYDQPPPPPGYTGYYIPRNEVTLGANSRWGHYRLGAYGRRDLATNRFVALGLDGAYEDECFIFDIRFNRRYTSYNGDSGSSTVLFQLTFKTIGQFGFRAM